MLYPELFAFLIAGLVLSLGIIFYLKRSGDGLKPLTPPKTNRPDLAKVLEKTRKIFLKVYRERISNFTEVAKAHRAGEFHMFYDFSWDKEFSHFDKTKLIFQGKSKASSSSDTGDLNSAKESLQLVKQKIENVSQSDWNAENLKNILWDWSATIGRGQILHPLRTLLSLREKSPDPFTIMEIIGKVETLRRLEKALDLS
jgi:glutamyl/glutaminyl-tRNA synthetase